MRRRPAAQAAPSCRSQGLIVRVLGGAVALVLAVAGIIALRDATLSTHQPMDPESRIELVLRLAESGGEARQTAEEMAEALILVCRLEVNADPVGPVRSLGTGRFSVVLTPSMDKTDQRQFRGCIEDFTIDHIRADVESLRPMG